MRAYASYLGLDPEPLLRSLNGEHKTEPVPQEAAALPARQEFQSFSPNRSEKIFEEIGERLQHQRELLGLSLEDVERHTHLRIHYLQALEAGRLEDLPSSVQGRGMLKNYAEFLSLDPEPVLLRFADALQTRLTERQSTRPKPAVRPRARRSLASMLRGFPGDFLLGGFLLLLLVGFVVWGAIRISSLSSQVDSLPTIPSIADELLTSGESMPTPTATNVVTPLAGVAEESSLPAPSPAAADVDAIAEADQGPNQGTPPLGDLNKLVNISIAVLQRTWVRITVDGEIEFEGRMLPGNAYTFSGDEEVSVLTGNGAALQVFFNDQDLGTMGIYGEVVNRVFTSEGMVMPTPTITPRPSLTPTETSMPQTDGTPQTTP